MSELRHRAVKTNGINLHVAEQGEGPPVLLIHGFPELWYSWRHQLPALAAAGYHAVAPDVRGYGRSDAPEPIEAYSMREMTADMIGLLDALGEEQAVVVGHDWGSPIAWHCALLYPERVRAVVAMSVPFVPRSPAPPLQMLRQIFKDVFFYMLYFQEPGVAEAELEADPKRSLRLFMYAASGDAPPNLGLGQKPKDSTFLEGMPEPDRLPDWLTEEDLDYYASEFARTGFRGGLNRYRNMDRDWEELPQLADATVQQPALFIAGEKDGVLQFTRTEPMQERVPNLRDIVLVPGAGHWVQQEAPAAVNDALLAFLRELDG